MFPPAVRCVSGQSLRARLYAEYVVLPPLHSCPSGTKPVVRPAASERRTPNQLYSGLAPPWATAAWQAGLLGVIWPVDERPSFQHRKVRLPGTIAAPCAWAAPGVITVMMPAATTATAAAAAALRRSFTLDSLSVARPGDAWWRAPDSGGDADRSSAAGWLDAPV